MDSLKLYLTFFAVEGSLSLNFELDGGASTPELDGTQQNAREVIRREPLDINLHCEYRPQ